MNDAVLNIVIKAQDKATKAVSGVTSAIGNSTGKIDAFAKKANQIGGSMTKRVTAPILAAAAAGIKFATDFNASMANVATLIPGNTKRVDELKRTVQDMAVRVGKSTADLSEGLYNTISAFGDTADTAKILEINAKSAAAGMAETTDAINLTSAVTKGYGDTSSKAVQQASDLSLMTVRLGQTTFPELAASIGRVTGTAADLNVTQEELFGTMATFTGVTGGAAEVSTQLAGVFAALNAPTEDMVGVFEELGVESGKAAVEQHGLQGVIEAVAKAQQKSGKPMQSFVGSLEGQRLVTAAVGGQADAYTEKIKAMGDVAGTTDIAFGEATEGVNKAGFTMQQARAEVEVLAQQIGDHLAPHVVAIAGHVSDLASRFGKLTPEGQKTVLIVAGLTAALGPALIAIGKMAQGVSASIKFVKLLGSSWVGTAAKAVASSVKSAAKTTASWVASAARTLASWVATFTVMMARGALWVVTTVGRAAIAAGAMIAGAVAVAAAWVVANAAMLLGIGLVIVAVIGLVILIVKNWDTIKAAAVATWEFIKKAVAAVIDFLKRAIAAYFNFYLSIFKRIQSVAVAVFNAIKNFIAQRIENIKNNFARARDFAVGVFNAIRDRIRQVVDNAVGYFRSLPGRIAQGLKNIGAIVSGPFKAAFNAIARLWNSTAGKLSFTAPDWVPGLGGKGFSLPKLPQLAEGGIVRARRGGTAAVLAEGGQDEAVIPLDSSGASKRLQQAMGQVNNDNKQVVNITNNNTFVRDTDPVAFARMQAFELSRR